MSATQFIVSLPFTGRDYSSITNGTVDYSGYLYNNGGPNLSPEEYLKINAHRYHNPVILSSAEFERVYLEHIDGMKTKFSEVTEAQYYDALECLPPMRWRDISAGLNAFFISEAYTADLHSCFIADRTTGKYYAATRSKFETNEELVSIFKSSL